MLYPYMECDRKVIYVAAATGRYSNCEAGAAFAILYDQYITLHGYEAARCIRGKVSLQDALLQALLFAIQHAPPHYQLLFALDDDAMAATLRRADRARKQGRRGAEHPLVSAVLDMAETRGRADPARPWVLFCGAANEPEALNGMQGSRMIARKMLLNASARPHM